jgi:hypothetical protein
MSRLWQRHGQWTSADVMLRDFLTAQVRIPRKMLDPRIIHDRDSTARDLLAVSFAQYSALAKLIPKIPRPAPFFCIAPLDAKAGRTRRLLCASACGFGFASSSPSTSASASAFGSASAGGGFASACTFGFC